MKKNKKRNAPPPVSLPKESAPSASPINKKALVLRLLLHSVLFLGVYFACVGFGVSQISVVYLVGGALLAIGYLIYNKGFAYRGVTEEQLSDSLSTEEKRALLVEMRERDVRSKWVLTILLPIVVTLLLDTLYLFVLPTDLGGWFG
jgi:hypothetical protein